MYELKKIKIKSLLQWETLDFTIMKQGETTHFDIYIKKNDEYMVILRTGSLITKKVYKLLEKQDYLYILKNEKQTLNCEPMLVFIKNNSHDIKKSLNFLYEINAKLFTNFTYDQKDIIDLKCINTIVESIIYLIKNNKNYLKDILPHLSSKHTLSNHSLHVSIYAINLSRLLNFEDVLLQKIGIAGLLHDTGLKKIDDTIINSNKKLTLHELEHIHAHAQHSVDIAKSNNIKDIDILDAIIQHHENQDSSGYPNHLQKSAISNLASILSISDVFDALTTERPQRKKMMTFDALKLMLQDSEMVNKFNKKYITVFL